MNTPQPAPQLGRPLVASADGRVTVFAITRRGPSMPRTSLVYIASAARTPLDSTARCADDPLSGSPARPGPRTGGNTPTTACRRPRAPSRRTSRRLGRATQLTDVVRVVADQTPGDAAAQAWRRRPRPRSRPAMIRVGWHRRGRVPKRIHGEFVQATFFAGPRAGDERGWTDRCVPTPFRLRYHLVGGEARTTSRAAADAPFRAHLVNLRHSSPSPGSCRPAGVERIERRPSLWCMSIRQQP